MSGDLEESERRTGPPGCERMDCSCEPSTVLPQGGILNICGGDRRTGGIGFQDVVIMEGEGISKYSLEVAVVGDHEQPWLTDRRDDLRYAVGGVVDEHVAIG